MPRTLFNIAGEETCAKIDTSVELPAHYDWIPSVQALPIGDHIILVNPDNGGWVSLDKEIAQLNQKKRELQQKEKILRERQRELRYFLET